MTQALATQVFDPQVMGETEHGEGMLREIFRIDDLGISRGGKVSVGEGLDAWCTHGLIMGFNHLTDACRIQRLSTGVLVLWFQRHASGVRLLVDGPWCHATDVPHQGVHESIILMLRPGASRAVFGLPASELSGRRQDLDDVLPGEGGRLCQRLGEIRCPDAVLQAMCSWVRSRLAGLAQSRDLELTAGLRRWMASSGRLPDLQCQVGGSQRQIQRWFADGVGLTPRQLDCLWQVGRVVRRSLVMQRPDWTALALEHGFSDQAHLVRRWGEVIGRPPAQFHRAWRAGGRWVDGLIILPSGPAAAVGAQAKCTAIKRP